MGNLDQLNLLCRYYYRCFILHLSSFLYCFKDTLQTVLGYARFSPNSSLGITLLVQTCHFMPKKLYYPWHFT